VAGHEAGAEKNRNSYTILVGASKGKRKPGRLRFTWKDSTDGGRAPVKMISNLVFPKSHISHY